MHVSQPPLPPSRHRHRFSPLCGRMRRASAPRGSTCRSSGRCARWSSHSTPSRPSCRCERPAMMACTPTVPCTPPPLHRRHAAAVAVTCC
eukprot:3525779-Prymnesium_polylepis.1